MRSLLLRLLGGIVFAVQAITPIGCTFLLNVIRPPVCRLSRLCTPLEGFDGFQCHLAGAALVGPNDTDTLHYSRAPSTIKKRFGGLTFSQNCNCCYYLANWIQTRIRRFRFLPNYFCYCLCIFRNIC